MLILADENIDGSIVTWLRSQHYDVLWMAEGRPGEDDSTILELAESQKRIVLTYDLDFGHMVFRERKRCSGVVLLRFHASSPQELLEVFGTRWPRIVEIVEGQFVVVTDSRIRVRPLPGP